MTVQVTTATYRKPTVDPEVIQIRNKSSFIVQASDEAGCVCFHVFIINRMISFLWCTDCITYAAAAVIHLMKVVETKVLKIYISQVLLCVCDFSLWLLMVTEKGKHTHQQQFLNLTPNTY